MSNVKCQMSNVKCQMSNVKCHGISMSNVKCHGISMSWNINVKWHVISMSNVMEFRGMSWQCHDMPLACQMYSAKSVDLVKSQ